MYKVIVTEPAEYDLLNIEEYITHTLKNPDAAIRTVDAIVNTMASLNELPERQPYVNDALLSGIGVRLIQVNNYNIFYEIDDREVYILRVLYNRADWQMILSVENK